MTQEHPITPPPELVQQWWDGTHGAFYEFQAVATQAARWGADQQLKLDIEQVNQAWQRGADHELEACCQALFDRYDIPSCISPKFAEEMRDWLRAARRPKPPSLKEQALALINHDPENQPFLSEQGIAIIRRALESLPDEQ